MVNGFPELGSFRAFNGLSSFEGQNSGTKDKSKESVHNYDRKLHSKSKKLGSGYSKIHIKVKSYIKIYFQRLDL